MRIVSFYVFIPLSLWERVRAMFRGNKENIYVN
jgi:hypothetical protein